MDRRVIAFTLALISAIAVPLCASSGWARGLGVLVMGGGMAAPTTACVDIVSDDSNEVTGAYTAYAVSNASRYEMGSQYVASTSYAVCAVEVRLGKVGSPTAALTAKIYESSGGVPGTLIATSTTSINGNDMTAEAAWYKFSFSGVAFASGSIYFISVSATTLGGASDYYKLEQSVVAGRSVWGRTTSWASLETNTQLAMRIYR